MDDDRFTPGESDYAERCLSTLRFLVARKWIHRAVEMLEILDTLSLTAEQQQLVARVRWKLAELVDQAEERAIARREVAQLSSGPPPVFVEGRVLAFRSGSLPRVRSAPASVSSRTSVSERSRTR